MYERLDRDEKFWADFYRTLGYHAEIEQNQELANASRARALTRLKAMLESPKFSATKKETFVAAGAMAFLLGDREGAISYFDAALTAPYRPEKSTEEQRKNGASYLDGLVKEYLVKAKLTA